MKPRRPNSAQGSFLLPDLASQLDPRQSLSRLAMAIDWKSFEEAFGPLYSAERRPALPIRRMVGLLMLKHLQNLSDERVVEFWSLSPYAQFFCGEREMQWGVPCEASELVHFRKRIGPGGAEKIFFVAVACSWVLFRAHSFREAASILSSMWGLNGFTVPFNIGEAELGLGRLFSAIGASIVPAEACIEGLSYAWSIHGVIALLAMVWLLPNTQQLLARLDPILEKVDKPARWQLRLSFTGGLVLALPLVLVLRTFLGTQVSPFLYFNF